MKNSMIRSCDKILGLHVDNNLTWNNHFNFLSKKISSSIWLLSKIRTYLSTDHRLLFYNAYIKPHFDYCSIIWSNSSNANINRVTKLQRRACKLILGAEYTSGGFRGGSGGSLEPPFRTKLFQIHGKIEENSGKM